MNRLIHLSIFIWVFFLPGTTCDAANPAEQPDLDSIQIVLKNAGHDTTRLRLLADLSGVCDFDDILKYALPAVELADKLLKDKSYAAGKSGIINHKAEAFNNIAFIYNLQGDISKSLDYYKGSLSLYETIADKEGIAISLNNLGIMHDKIGDISKALDYYSKCLKIREGMGDIIGTAQSLNNIGFIFKNQGDLTRALEYYVKSLKLHEQMGDKKGIAVALNNIAAVYERRGDIVKALSNYKKCLQLNEETGNRQGVAISLNNIGVLYKNKDSLKLALDYCSRSLQLDKEMGIQQGIAGSYNNIGAIYMKFGIAAKNNAERQKMYKLAHAYEDSSLAISKKLGFPVNIRNAESLLSMIDSAQGNFAGAFEHFKQHVKYRDSINNQVTRKAGIKNHLKYEFEKKEAIIKEQQEKERAVAEGHNRRQQIIIWSVVLGLVLVILFSGFVFRTLRETRKQKLIIEQKQREILDSIHYAKRIQTALMTNENYIHKNLEKLKGDS